MSPTPPGTGEPPDDSAIGVGTELADKRYVLLKAIGRGGMGDIYKALDRQLDRVVAIKAIRADVGTDTEARKRLAREARVAASLDHPFICKIHELIQRDDGDLLLVMEFINGQSLKDVLDSGPIGAGHVVQIAREMTEALSVAHQKGLIHRDIKPSNVMLTSHGHVKVVDFGIAKGPHQAEALTTTTVTKAGRVIGTPAYMSPEHAAGKPIDARADIYSLGAVLYECLTGTLPFIESDDAAAAAAALPTTAPADLRALIMKCLEWKREARYQNLEEVTAALDAPGLAGITGTTGIRSLMAEPWHQRRGSWRLVVAAGLAIVAGGWAWSKWTNLQAGRSGPGSDFVQRPIVTWQTREEGSRVSNDGLKIAFTSTQHGQTRLLVQAVAVDGTEPAPIGAPGDRIKTPIWSPDGQNLAYLFSQDGVTGIQIIEVWGARKPGQAKPLEAKWEDAILVRWVGSRIYFSVSSGGTTSTLWRYDTSSRAVEKVTHQQGRRFTATGRIANVDVMLDESRIVFEGAAPYDRRLWVADLDGRNAESLAVGPMVVFSPRWRDASGKRVVYVSNANGQSDIWEFNLDSHTATPLTTSPLEEKAISASAAGDVIVADTMEENAHLWALQPDRTETLRQLTFDSRPDLWPGFSAHDDRILFQRAKSSFLRYATIDADLITARWKDGRLTEDATLVAGTSGLFSPDGRRVAFARLPDQDLLNAEIWVQDVGSMKVPIRVSDGSFSLYFDYANWDQAGQTVAWGPTGSSTLYFVQRGNTKGTFELIEATLSDPLASKLRVIGRVVSPLQYTDLATAPDGTALAYTLAGRLPYDGGRLELLDLARPGQPPGQLLEARAGTEVSIAGWRRNGAIIVVVSPRPSSAEDTQVWEVQRDGRKRELMRVRGLQGFTARLDVSRDRLFSTIVTDGVVAAGQIALVDRTQKILVPNSVDGITFGGFAISPEGWLVYMRKETNHNVWLFDFRKAKRSDSTGGH